MMKAQSLQKNTKDSLANKYPKLIAASKENSDAHVQKFVKALNQQVSKENGQ